MGVLLMFAASCCFFLTTKKCPHKSILNCEALLFLHMAVSGLSAGAMSESIQTPKKRPQEYSPTHDLWGNIYYNQAAPEKG